MWTVKKMDLILFIQIPATQSAVQATQNDKTAYFVYKECQAL